MPNLENLKKQAKLVLRWHRERYYPVAAQIRALLPRFRNMTDPQVLAHSFRLTDAQELVARQHGFDSWRALKTGLPAMAKHAKASSRSAVITVAEPQLFVRDIMASCDFFTGKLGFSIGFTYGEPPFYGQVKRDQARLNLRCVDKPVIDPVLRDTEQLLSAAMTDASGDELKQLFLEFSVGGSYVFSNPQEGAVGRENFHH